MAPTVKLRANQDSNKTRHVQLTRFFQQPQVAAMRMKGVKTLTNFMKSSKPRSSQAPNPIKTNQNKPVGKVDGFISTLHI